MKRSIGLATLIFSTLCASQSLSKTGVFENLLPGDAVMIASKATAVPAVMAVRLDGVCEADGEDPLAYQVEDALAAKGIRVDPAAPLILRYEIAPCETDFSRKPNLAQQDAYRETSRANELDPPVRPFQFKLGRGSRSGARLTLNLLLFKPGQPPLWNALIAARAPGQETQDYLAQMAIFALGKVGEEGELKFEIETEADTN
ncbi:MAG: hypothetical protein AAF337_01200 [Pseudomonadota bacterium]